MGPRLNYGDTTLIRAVVFDFGQTLVDSADGFRLAEKAAQRKLFKHLRLDSWDSFLDYYRLERKRFKAESDFSRRSLWRAVIAGTSGAPCEESLLMQWEAEYWQTVHDATRLFPETQRVLHKLRYRYRLGIITNTQGDTISGTHRMTEFPELAGLFESVVIAGEAGIPAKPDPRPFLMCLEELKLRRDEILYVGDDWDIDIVGASNAGIKAVWLKHRAVRRNWPDVTPNVPVIDNLDALCAPGILESG